MNRFVSEFKCKLNKKLKVDYDLRGGVLIIGSLFWQDDRDANGDDLRRKWRNERLIIGQAVNMRMPIRYGRFSGSVEKGNQTYTIVIDNTLPREKFGKAKVVPLKSNPANWGQLKEEVEQLSNAEDEGTRFIKWSSTRSEAWCVCGICFKPTVSEAVKGDILENWEIALKESHDGYKAFIKKPAQYGLSGKGELAVQWPNEAKDLDFLIATSTLPKLRDSVTELTIQEFVNHVSKRQYFIPNFLRGIGTYRDREILSAINTDRELTRTLFEGVVENYESRKQNDKNHRYWSWDHCYTAFHSELDNDTKALHLATYLASWGMNRGSGGLLQKDYKIHVKTIEILSDAKYSSLDCYNQNYFSINKIDLLFKLVDELSEHYSSITYERMGDRDSISPTDTLISKILLGTISCVPAFDEFLKEGLGLGMLSNRRLSKRGMTSLLRWVESFAIESHRNTLPESARDLPVMKLLDIYFWSLGYNLSIIEK